MSGRLAPIAGLDYQQPEPDPGVTPTVLETQGRQVLNSRFRALAAVMAFATAALAGCGGDSGSGGSASVRLVNATLTHASIDLLANGDPVVGATLKNTVSEFADVEDGSPALQVNDTATNAVLAVTAPTVSEDQKFALIAYESGGAVRTAVISEGTDLPPANTAIVRVFNAATDAGSIDVYITDPAVDITTLSSPTFSFTASTSVQASNFASFGAPGPLGATYRIRVTGAGNPSDLRLDIPSVLLLNQRVATVILTPTVGGTLANGSVLIEEGPDGAGGVYAATPNTSARVRLVAAATNGASVSAVASPASAPIAIGTNVVAPTVGTYVSVPSGSPISVTVDGAPITAPSATLAAGSDSTLMVYGNLGSVTATLIPDDNHLPTAANSYKLRLVNGLTGAAVPLSMDVNFGNVASNVQPGAASPYSVLNQSVVTQISVTSPNSLVPIFPVPPNATIAIPGGAVFTLFMLGDAGPGNPIGVLRKDR